VTQASDLVDKLGGRPWPDDNLLKNLHNPCFIPKTEADWESISRSLSTSVKALKVGDIKTKILEIDADADVNEKDFYQ